MFTNRIGLLLQSALLSLVVLPLSGQEAAGAFSYEQSTVLGMTVNYRKAEINPESHQEKIVVLYLHGGSSKGSDNTTQMSEAGIDSIYHYLKGNGIKGTFVVPQCPTESSWGGKMNGVVKALLDEVSDEQTSRYILGGSMGGTATIGMLSDYPGYFAGAMAVAANPMNGDAGNVALSRFYSVMGTADAIMKVQTMETFIDNVIDAGGNAKIDVEEGWTHEQTCVQSYTGKRLSWIFSQLPTSITPPSHTDDRVVAVYALNGKKLQHFAKGINIVRRADGTMGKVFVRP